MALPALVILEVYPRVCGGTIILNAALLCRNGLSPRVRGNRPRTAAIPPIWRSIPACAGEPYDPPRPTLQGEVYPRVCGGTVVRISCVLFC